jgi:ribonuclease Z
MSQSQEPEATSLSRRDALKIAGLAVGGLAAGSALIRAPMSSAQDDDSCVECEPVCPADKPNCDWAQPQRSQRYTYFDQLPPFYPFRNLPFRYDPLNSTIPLLGKDQMRITFMGSSIPPTGRKVQQMMSVFVEVGWDDERQMPLDNLVFDCGSGVCDNYSAMNVSFMRMNKIFLNHLHGDHMSDLTHIYCFGPSQDRLSPLYVWGPGPSNLESPKGSGTYYDDGTQAFCEHFRAMCRWHTESFSFENTSYTPKTPDPDTRPLWVKWGLPYDAKPVGKYEPADADNDGYAIVPIELPWDTGGVESVAYDNKKTGVRVTYFPVIHARQGSIGYKLEFTPPGVPGAKTLSMIYTSDTKPETLSVENAKNGTKGVDVFIHEMIVPAEIWAMKLGHLTDPSVLTQEAIDRVQTVQNSSHSPQGAFGYLLSLIDPKPRLTVATHFPVADDTVACAKKSVMEHVNIVQGRDPKPKENAARITWSFDLMVITVSEKEIVEKRGVVGNFGFGSIAQPIPGTPNPPKYANADGTQNPYAQIDQDTAILPCDCDTGACHYREDGY